MLRLAKHYLRFSRYTMISKFNYKNPKDLVDLSMININIMTSPFITNYIIASSLILLISKQYPKFISKVLTKKSSTINLFKVTLRKSFLFLFLDNMINLCLVKNTSFLRFETLGFSNVYVYITSLYFFPEFMILFSGRINSTFNKCFTFNINFSFTKHNTILEKQSFLSTLQVASN